MQAVLGALLQSDWQADMRFFHINLLFNRCTQGVLPSIFEFLEFRQNVTMNVGYNQFTMLDLQKALLQAGHSDWLDKRLFHELGDITRHLSNTAVLLEQNLSIMNGWTEHADTSTEKEVIAAVIRYLKDAVTL